MATAQAFKALSKVARSLAKKKKRAIKVSKSALKKGKELTSTAKSALKGAATAAAGTRTAQMAAEGTKKMAAKVVKKIPKKTRTKIKKTVSKTKEKVKKQFEDQTGTFGEKPNLRTRATGLGKGIAGAAAFPGNIAGAIAGPSIGKGLRAGRDALRKAMGKPVKVPNTEKKMIRGVMDVERGGEIGGRISQGIAAIGAGALTASLMSSNNNPKSDYEMKRSGEGFQLKFNDEGKNKILTGKALNQKQVDEVRSIIAYMESIIVSDNPKARQKEFIAAMDQLSGYGVNSVVGKNLMINMPQSFANPRNW